MSEEKKKGLGGAENTSTETENTPNGAETPIDEKKKKRNSPGRDERGRFIKGHTLSEGQLFEKENAAACKYKPEYCEKMLEYFSQPPTRVEYWRRYDKEGNILEEKPMVVPNEYPTFESFAASIGVTTRTLLNWCEENHRFSHYYARARELQKGKLITNTLSGFYNPQFAKFEAINNHGMTEKTQQDASLVLSVKMSEEIDEESF